MYCVRALLASVGRIPRGWALHAGGRTWDKVGRVPGVGAIPDDVAGGTWDGGPVRDMPLPRFRQRVVSDAILIHCAAGCRGCVCA